QNYFAPLENGSSYALAGPAELIFSNAALITFYQVTNSAIRTQFIANDPIVIPIASNKTMRLFGVPAPVNAGFSRPGSGFVSFTLFLSVIAFARSQRLPQWSRPRKAQHMRNIYGCTNCCTNVMRICHVPSTIFGDRLRSCSWASCEG